MDILNQLATDCAAAADGQLDDITLLQRYRRRPVLAEHTLHKLLVNRLAVGKLSNDEGHHGGDGEGQQLLVGCGHLHNQHGAGNRRAHGGGKEGGHGYDHDVGGINRLDPAEQDEHLGADAAAKRTDNEHGQEEAAGNAAAVAYEREEQLACEKDEQQLQGYRRLGELVDELVAAAEHLGQEVAQYACAEQGEDDFMHRLLEQRQAVEAADVQKSPVEEDAERTGCESDEYDDAVVAQGQQLQVGNIKNSGTAKDGAGDYRGGEGCGHGGQQHHDREVAVQLLQRKDYACQRRIEGCGQTGAGTARQKVAFLHARASQKAADALGGYGAELNGRALATK